MMRLTAPTRTPSVASRQVGYAIAGLLNVGLLYVANVWPGWQAVPFLTEDASQVLVLFNVSAIVGLIANAVYLAHDPQWLISVGGVITTSVGFAVLVQVWQVFPFAFDGASFDWPLLVRLVLAIALVGSVIGVIVQLVSLARLAFRS
jgi:hypothetical protein